MRVKKRYVILTFRTTTDAMALENACQAQGLPGRMIPVPREITAGCGLAWRIPHEAYDASAIEALRVPIQQIVALEM